MLHFSKGSSKNINLSPTTAATASGGVTTSSPAKAVLSTMITSQNISKELSLVSSSIMRSSNFVISTASKAVAVVSSLANLLPNTGKDRSTLLHNSLVKTFVSYSARVCKGRQQLCISYRRIIHLLGSWPSHWFFFIIFHLDFRVSTSDTGSKDPCSLSTTQAKAIALWFGHHTLVLQRLTPTKNTLSELSTSKLLRQPDRTLWGSWLFWSLESALF